MKSKTLRLLIISLVCMGAFAAAAPACYAADYKYTNVRSYINDGDRYVRQAQDYRRQADTYRREAERCQRDADSYARRKDFRRADDYQRRADRAIDRMRDYIGRAERADANAAAAYRRAAATVERR